jgi:hypothetical protein
VEFLHSLGELPRPFHGFDRAVRPKGFGNSRITAPMRRYASTLPPPLRTRDVAM